MIPKRAIGAIVTTTLGLVLLFSFKTPEAPRTRATSDAGVAVVGQPSAEPSAGTTGSGTVDPATAPSSGSTTGGSSGTTASSAYRDGTYDGATVQTRYGDVQIELTIAGGVITDVTALQLPSGDGHSDRISQEAAPILRSEALTAQDAQIDILSGATYTSTAYAESLQAALDQARA
jgi:uncharacterized protein with FMN-binding domain